MRLENPGRLGSCCICSQSKEFQSFSTVSQSGEDIRLNHVIYSKRPRPGTTEVIPNQGSSWESLLRAVGSL